MVDRSSPRGEGSSRALPQRGRSLLDDPKMFAAIVGEGIRRARQFRGWTQVQLSEAAERVKLFSRVWKMVGFAITFGFWRPGATAEENSARQFNELNLRAQDQRNQLLRCFNQLVE